MSIASIIKGNEFNEFKDYLKTYSPIKKRFTSSTGYPPFSKDIPVRVPAANITSHESGHIGELADFLFCLEIARYVDKNKELIFDSLIWRARELFDSCLRTDQFEENNQRHRDLFDRAISSCHKYVLGRDISLRELVYSSNIINKAEHYLHYTKFKSRAEFLDYFLIPCPPHVADEVIKLVTVFNENFISSGIVKKDSVVVCHPWFEPWSSAVGGGIADLYLDGVLYDFKSTKKTGYSWEDVGQLYGYYILNRLCLKYSKESVLASPIPITNIHTIALYYSRLGDIETCNLLESNAVLPDSEVEYISNIIHEHNKEHYNATIERLLEDIAKKLILREINSRKITQIKAIYTPENVGYNIGDTVYSYLHGKGTVLRFRKTNHSWNTAIGFESGKTLEGDINSICLLNWHSKEMLAWRQFYDHFYETNWSDDAAVSALFKERRELQASIIDK